MTLELEALVAHGILQARFQIRRDRLERIRIEHRLEVLAAGIRLRVQEQAVVQAHFGFQRAGGADPRDVALDLVVVRARRARLRILEILHVDGGDVAVGILVKARALDHVAILQAHAAARQVALRRREAEVALDRRFHEVFLLDPQFAREREGALAHLGMVRVHGRAALVRLAFGEVVDDELQRAQHGNRARRLRVEIITQRAFERAHVDPAVGLRHADALAEQLQRFGRVAAAAQANDGRHARIVPAGDGAIVDQRAQLALGGHDIGQVQAREFVLARHGLPEEAAFGQRLDQPVVERAVILEFQRAQRVRDVFDRIRDRVRVVVHRVDAPGVARAVVVRMADAVQGRIAVRHDGRGHRVFAHLGAQDVFAILVLAGFHVAEQLQRFFDRAVAEARIGAQRAEIAAVLRHLFGALAVDVGFPVLDQVLGHRVQLVEVVAGVVQVLLALLLPRETEPLDAVDDRVDVFLVFLLGIGVVETQVAQAAVVARQAEVQADRFGVADVQVAIRLGREARDHGRQALTGMRAGGQVGFDDGTHKVRRRCVARRRGILVVAHEIVLGG